MRPESPSPALISLLKDFIPAAALPEPSPGLALALIWAFRSVFLQSLDTEGCGRQWTRAW